MSDYFSLFGVFCLWFVARFVFCFWLQSEWAMMNDGVGVGLGWLGIFLERHTATGVGAWENEATTHGYMAARGLTRGV
jgi:hypothetical protein